MCENIRTILKYKNKDIVGDAICWDIVNWSKAIAFWENHLKGPDRLRTLELGCDQNGGLSVWLGSKGYDVVCSGYNGIGETTKKIHEKYRLSNIQYHKIDALSIPYEEYFDIVCFKSMLGGIVKAETLVVAEKVMSEIYKALRPGGVLLFAENLKATIVHTILRRKYGSLKDNWRYFSVKELIQLLSRYSSIQYKTFGLIGCFGRSENQRKVLSKLDGILFDRIFSEQSHYIIAVIAAK